MVYEFKFPDVGEGITEGKLVSWYVKVGDEVKTDETVCSVETDKSIIEIPSPVSGKVSELLNNEGDDLKVGDIFMKIDTDNLTNSDNETPNEDAKENEPLDENHKEIEETKPAENILDNETNSSQILAMPKVKDIAKEKGIDLRTIKSTGSHGEITLSDLGQDNENLTQNNIPQTLDISETNKQEETNYHNPTLHNIIEKIHNTPENIQEVETSNSHDEIIASPSVRQLARNLNIDIKKVVGTGDNRRILEQDIKKIAEQNKSDDTSHEENKEVIEEKTDNKEPQKINTDHLNKKQICELNSQSDKRIPIEGIRETISKKMTQSLSKAAQVTICDEADVSELVNLRNREKEKLKEKGIKLTYLPFFIKSFIDTAREYPYFNAIVDDNSNEIILKSKYNICIATDTPRGLLVPVIKNANTKSIIELSNELVNLTSLAREGKLKLEDMEEGTFTITSIGNLRGQFFTPILNYPQTAILGIGKITKKPVVKNDEIIARDILTLSLTFDHRVIDGADASRFLKKYIELIEDVELLFMES